MEECLKTHSETPNPNPTNRVMEKKNRTKTKKKIDIRCPQRQVTSQHHRKKYIW